MKGVHVFVQKELDTIPLSSDLKEHILKGF